MVLYDGNKVNDTANDNGEFVHCAADCAASIALFGIFETPKRHAKVQNHLKST